MKVLISILIMHIVFIPLFSNTNHNKIPLYKNVLEKSLLYPGWGQIIEKQYIKGFGFMLLETGLIISAIIINNKSNEYYNDYKNATNIDDVIYWRQKTEEFDKNRNLLILSAAFVWVVNLIDIYIHVKKKKRRLKLGFIKKDEKTFALNFTYNF